LETRLLLDDLRPKFVPSQNLGKSEDFETVAPGLPVEYHRGNMDSLLSVTSQCAAVSAAWIGSSNKQWALSLGSL